MDEKKVVDVSSFMLFEATGDSEANSELNMDVDVVTDEEDEEDAESCSCDNLLDRGPIAELEEFDDENLAHAHEEVHPVIDDDDDSDDDEVMMSSMVKDRQHKKSKGCVESAMELMSEMEKSKLFWETCLAS
ncbi:uncharacterized protein LOC130790823 [Actinidia eriantha]|uniref:uncharacterized protein LOC130790823 n=1 Tax=Actinidia eriantha TaxID=165200 RepID=UPI00258435B6|nr:uncharacterized protein LOC130790823 [Actinidia eriantha]